MSNGLRLAGLALVALLGFGRTAQAAPILVVNGPNDTTLNFTVWTNLIGVGFTTTTNFVNVSIDIGLASFFAPATVDMNAFLTTQVGPGTTAAHEVASTTTQAALAASSGVPPFTVTQVNLFSGLSLSAGTYFLTVQPVSGTAFWAASSDAFVNVTASGASLTVPSLLGFGQTQPYFPSTEFFPVARTNFWFSVTGDPEPVQNPVVPEPATLALLGSGLAAVAAARRRRRRI